jgi:predicted nucleotidyltransferase
VEPSEVKLPSFLANALSSYKRRLVHRFGDRLQLVALFGSWARGDQHGESDVDVLVLIRSATQSEQNEAAGMVADVDLETEVWLTPKVYSTQQFEHLKAIESPFARSITHDAIPQ